MILDGDTDDLDISDCMVFFSGFDTECTLNFNSCNVYPTASTCALTLTLPTKYHDDYYHFKDKMLYAFANHGGFGLC